MALDGMLLHLLAKEIKRDWIGSRVEKIHQPSRSELTVSLRGFGKAGKLLLSASGNSPRIHFTRFAPENPQSPPMFCMLARKHLTGAKLIDVRTLGLERIMMLDFEATNELMDTVKITLCIEIMARHSNIIILDSDEYIIDCIKRVDESVSSVRLVLPALKYTLPPAQDKIDITESKDPKVIMDRLCEYDDLPLSKALSKVLLGSSALICREIARGIDYPLTDTTRELLKSRLDNFIHVVNNTDGSPTFISDISGKPLDFCFTDIVQYDDAAIIKKYPDFSSLLDDFYFERVNIDRSKNRATELIKLVKNLIERTTKKLNSQKIELEKCADREHLRICGELINANLYRLQGGEVFYELENFYSQDNAPIKIKADPLLSPAQNAQKYFKEYKKACNAKIMLTEQIKNGVTDLEYFESVLDELSRVGSDRELEEIKDELRTQGYIKSKQSKAKKVKELSPHKYVSDDGFTILVGRNNVQNDKLTFGSAKSDVWLHTKDIHGAHVIINTNGTQPPDATLVQAAMLAAFHSSAKNSSGVPVDYTLVKFVKKPSGSKPGGVIYTNQKTLYVTPDKELELALKVK
ncbi:MAG: NFACT family protein [Clostridia bacterium]|nr:NFACT family protein [Clostridia bacterium]